MSPKKMWVHLQEVLVINNYWLTIEKLQEVPIDENGGIIRVKFLYLIFHIKFLC